MGKIYKELIQAKNSSPVPIFFDDKPMHSKYNPEQEGKIFAESLNENTKFAVILGIGGGYHIQAIIDRNPEIKIIAIENSTEDLEFIKQIPCIKKLLKNKNITLLSAEETSDISKILENTYIPAIHGNLTILSQRVWVQENPEKVKSINEIIQNSLKKISADYSVQSHFGKIWQHNIFLNLLFFSENQFKIPLIFPGEKIAAVIAAGPSFDKSILKLKEKRGKYYIISTDTTFGSLLKNEIIPDAVVSIDGQNISHTHFMFSKKENAFKSKMKEIFSKTIFVFDLCANPAAIKSIYKNGGKILFATTGHPLSSIAGNFIHLESGAGTVTIAACDFAHKAGFSKIETFGADFSYCFGKPYTKGTYLDQNFNSISTRIETSQYYFSKLMFRTPLISVSEAKENEKVYTTEVLNSYRKTFEFWKEKIKTQSSLQTRISNPADFDFQKFLNKFTKIPEANTQEFFALLPYIAYLRKINSSKNVEFNELLKLAQSALLRYNFLYEK